MTKRQKLINLVYSNSKYWGRHVIILGDKIYSAKSGAKASKMLEELMKKNPSDTPTLTYVPKTDTLILFLHED
jgi:hypothetical protein